MPNIDYRDVKTNSSVDVLNAIRNSASQNYKDHVPLATPDANTIRSIGNVIMDFPEIQNEFLSALINRIAEVKVTNKYYTNPFAVFKKGKLNFGEVIEDIFIDLAHVKNYSPEKAETTVFQREFPDVKSAFYVMNYQKYYKQTVQPYDLENAFLSINGVSSFIEKIVTTMFTAMEQDEFLTIKYMLAYRIYNGLMKPYEIPAVNKANMEEIVEAIQTVSDDMTFLKRDYNLVGVNNFALKDDQYLIVSAKFNAKRNVEVLASAFNMDKVEFLGHIKLIDSFGSLDIERLNELFKGDENYHEFSQAEMEALDAVPCVLVDKDFFQIYDKLTEMRAIENTEGLYRNMTLHAWRIYAISPFANNALFVAGTPSITKVTVSPATATLSKGGKIQLSAKVESTNFAPSGLTWTSNSNKATVTSTGIVTVSADAVAKDEIIITATSVYDNTKFGTATITVA